MIKESISRLLNERNEVLLLLSQRGRLLFLNSSAHQYFEEVSIPATDTIYPIFSPDSQEVLQKALNKRLSSTGIIQHFGGVVIAEYAQVPVKVWLSNTATSQEDVFILILQPIREALPNAKSVELYKLVTDHSPDVISVYDANFNCVYVHDNAYRQLGHALVDYYTNSGFLQFVESSYHNTLLSQIEKDTQKRVQFSKYYYLARQKNGTRVKVVNFIIRIFGTDDQLYRLIANERISSVEANTLTTTQAKEELILADAHYLIHYVSPLTERVLGVEQNGSVSLFSVIHPDDHAKLLANQEQTGDTVAVSSSRLRILQSPDLFRLVEASVHRFFNTSGQMVYIAISWPDSDAEEVGFWQSGSDDENYWPSTQTKGLPGGPSLLLQEDLTIRYASPEVKSLLGYSPSELYGQDITELVPENSRATIKNQLDAAFVQSVPKMVSLVKKKDKTHQPFGITLKIIQEDGSPPVLFITLDKMSFTDPKLFQLVPNYLPDAVFLLKKSDSSIIEANTSAVALLRRERAQLIGTTFFSLWDPQVMLQFQALLSTQTDSAAQDIWYTTTEGHSFWGNTAVKPLADEESSSENVIVVRISDITSRKEQEIELKRRATQQSVGAEDRLLSQISHEIRTPLNAIMGITHLMLQSSPREDQKKMLQTLKFSGDNLAALINDILDLSKIEAGKLRLESEEFNLLEFIQGIKLTYKSLVSERGILFRLLIEDEVPSLVVGDINRLGQILNNLLSNAVKFTEKGQIVLSVYVEQEEKEHFTLLFEVADTGIGIPKDKLSVIFEPYQQAGPSKYGGTGLGLSIVKSIVDLQDGRISVQSTENKGSTFRVALPFGKSSQSETTQKETDQSFMTEFQSLEGLKVLYVEDVIPNQLLMEGLSDKWNVQLDTALNGLEALQKVKNHQYDLILMDIQMPEMDGYEATREIRNLKDPHYENIPIIALTASVSEKTRARIQEMGMNDFISKPIDPKNLHQKLAELAKGRPTDSAVTSSLENPISSDFTPDFTQLRELYLDDNIGYVEILGQIQRLILESFPIIIDSVKSGEEEALRFNCHKIMSYVRLLRLDLLEGLLNQAKKRVGDTGSSVSADNVAQQLTRYFDQLDQYISEEITTYS
ncbi:MAG: ATP-binding protein [Bacteroidota bacterium]